MHDHPGGKSLGSGARQRDKLAESTEQVLGLKEIDTSESRHLKGSQEGGRNLGLSYVSMGHQGSEMLKLEAGKSISYGLSLPQTDEVVKENEWRMASMDK